MGEQRVSLISEGVQMQRFVRSLLDDVQALSYMLENDWFENDDIHIGAEQEMALGRYQELQAGFYSRRGFGER